MIFVLESAACCGYVHVNVSYPRDTSIKFQRLNHNLNYVGVEL